MNKRLEVRLEEPELREIQRLARRKCITVVEWVRQALRAAMQDVARGDAGKKLRVVRTAAEYSFPTADIEEMVGQIERGYLGAQTK